MFWKNTSFLKDMAYLTTMADKISFHRDHPFYTFFVERDTADFI